MRCALSALAVSLLLSASGCASPVKPPETADDSVASTQKHSRWNCDEPIEVTFAGERAYLQLDGGEHVLQRVPAASGTRYAHPDRASRDDGPSLWSKGPEQLAFSANGKAWQECSPASEAFSAKGQEPHWWLRIEGDRGQLMRPGLAQPIAFELRTLGSQGANTVISAAAPEATLEIRLRDSVCRDAMSGLPHPQTVTIELPDRQLRGCGGEPMQLLIAQPWRLEQTLPGHVQATLRFEQGSQLRMEGPCHRYVGSFTLDGEGLELRLPPSSQAACPEPAAGEERRLLDALSATVRFDIDDQGALILIGPNGRLLRASALPET
jgi:uncharacterized membrane protein